MMKVLGNNLSCQSSHLPFNTGGDKGGNLKSHVTGPKPIHKNGLFNFEQEIYLEWTFELAPSSSIQFWIGFSICLNLFFWLRPVLNNPNHANPAFSLYAILIYVNNFNF